MIQPSMRSVVPSATGSRNSKRSLACSKRRPWLRITLVGVRMSMHHLPMPEPFKLADQTVVAFAATTDPKRARVFYADTLGLPLLYEQLPFALVFDAHGTTLRVQIVNKVVPAGYTVLGWRVENIVTAAKALQEAGVNFERFPGMEQDDLGIWSSPSGAKVAWFKDPDGNTLSIGQQ